jgi:hypothetical protein
MIVEHIATIDFRSRPVRVLSAQFLKLLLRRFLQPFEIGASRECVNAPEGAAATTR